MSSPNVSGSKRKVRFCATSAEAAAGISAGALSELQAWVLANLREEPKTDSALVDAHLHSDLPTKRTPQRVRTARKELEKLGRVEWSGGLSKTPAQYKTQIWRVAA